MVKYPRTYSLNPVGAKLSDIGPLICDGNHWFDTASCFDLQLHKATNTTTKVLAYITFFLLYLGACCFADG